MSQDTEVTLITASEYGKTFSHAHAEANRKANNQKLGVASMKLFEILKRQLADKIRELSETSNPPPFIKVILPDRKRTTGSPPLPEVDGIPGDVLFYGHRTKNGYTVRTPLGIEEKDTVFARLQEFFWGYGWYLIEETDPTYGRAVVLVLYRSRPKIDHKYFNKQNLWHGHNMFFLDSPDPEEVEDSKEQSDE